MTGASKSRVREGSGTAHGAIWDGKGTNFTLLTGATDEELDVKDVCWINADGSEMQMSDWDGDTRCFGMLIDGRARPSGGSWHIPLETCMPQAAAPFQAILGEVYEIGARSLATFVRQD